eukprot:CAMPEP_0114173466 /NCGR_PEP_ID=MMETSP0043_2-20121206/35855_1 /TAXON_ID=464988 /ORGANISM="Hemiselmis andersenii, Strain CCMP644" /LENGTH=54 /DNA_ID=CAMNT_0001271473 /DNA_START=103 /DNA_END=264 /DNA_ORIENTATION=+
MDARQGPPVWCRAVHGGAKGCSEGAQLLESLVPDGVLAVPHQPELCESQHVLDS